MAILEVPVPQLSESVAEATLLQWHKKVGEAVARDENLIDIETDKVVLELPAPAQGVIVEILKENGSTVVAGEIIARIDTEATAAAGTASASAAPTTAPAPAPAPAPVAAAAASSSTIAMPAAARMLAENNMSASSVAGTGKDGRVTKGDVINAVQNMDAPGSLADLVAGYLDTEIAAIKAKTDNLPAAPAAVGDIPTDVQNADALLNRNVSGGSSTGRTVKQALHVLRNKSAVAAGTLTVYDTDDATSSWTATVSSDAAADPITGIDPA